MSIILIAFLALGSEKTPVFTAFLVIFPVITYNTMQGVRSVERELREMAAVFRLDTKEKLAFIYLPHILPFIAGGIRSACSLGWKAVIAAEVLVQPFRALGAGMQRAKVQLETAELFAWTCAVIAASSLTGGLFWLAGKIAGRPAGKANLRTKSKDNIALHKWHGSAKNKGTANTPAG
jgi:NitT/TauT family transport system permease protein